MNEQVSEQASTLEDAVMVVKYKQAVARELNAQAEVAELWATMTQAQRRLAISGRVVEPVT